MKPAIKHTKQHAFWFVVVATLALVLIAAAVVAQTKQELTQQVDALIAKADSLLAQAGAPTGQGGFVSSPWIWIPLVLIGVYVIWMLAQHARYRYFHGLDTAAVDELIQRLLQLAKDKLQAVHNNLPNRKLTQHENQVWQDVIETVKRRWSGTTGIMRWPVRSPLIRRIVRNGFNKTDANGHIIFVAELRDIPAAGGTPANPARTRLLDDLETCLTALLVTQQLLREEIGRYFYPRIVKVNAWERRLQQRITSPVIHSDHNVTFTYDTRLAAPGVTEVHVIVEKRDPSAGIPLNRSANGVAYSFTTTKAFNPGTYSYYYSVTRGAAGAVNEFDPLNMNRDIKTAGHAPPAGGMNTFTIS